MSEPLVEHMTVRTAWIVRMYMRSHSWLRHDGSRIAARITIVNEYMDYG